MNSVSEPAIKPGGLGSSVSTNTSPVVGGHAVESYRKDVDGLRGIAVLSVLIFHSSSTLLPGGFVGVDIFFVISGYLITSIILLETKQSKFSYAEFYKRRVIRLFPALLVTFAICVVYTLLAYTPDSLDRFGKQLVYGVLGLSNIYSAQGTNYFGSDISYTPLLHLWSLGVEEQFYLFWPTAILLLSFCRSIFLVAAIIAIIVGGVLLSELALGWNPLAAYFMPQYRAFELAIGALVAAFKVASPVRLMMSDVPRKIMSALSILSVVLLVVPMLLINEKTPFPGVIALFPCVGAALFLACQQDSVANRVVASKALVWFGLISYPLYLLHLPILSAVHYLGFGGQAIYSVLMLVLFAIPGAWLIYRYLEVPIRNRARQSRAEGDRAANRIVFVLLLAMLLFLGLGLLMAKTQGLPQRFAQINPYASGIYENRTRPLFNVSKDLDNLEEGGARSNLIFGDSLMQDYAPAIINALGWTLADVDLVTKAGCAFLKGIEAIPFANPEKCHSLRDQLYALDGSWDTVVFTQGWTGYVGRILNADKSLPEASIERWLPFVESTLDYFSERAENIILIAAHVEVLNSQKLLPNLFTTPEGYAEHLDNLSVGNTEVLSKARLLFDRLAERDNVTVIYPEDIWKTTDWNFHNGEFSYFVDDYHLSMVSVNYVEQGIKRALGLD